jgi:cell division protein FtsI/penicillin-binding protein 2
VRLVERRVGLLLVAFVALLAVAGLRAAWVGAVRSPDLKRQAAVQQVETVEVPAPRGTISDRNGVELAVSVAASDVAATPYLIKDPPAAARRLAPLLGAPADRVLAKLTRRDTGFVYLARQLPEPRADRIRKLDLAGIELIPRTRRVYPQDFLAAQTLGTVGTDGDGLAGLELSEDRRLRGRDGERRVVKDALGQPIGVRDLTPARPGTDLRLTLDAAIQEKVEQVLEQLGATYQPKGATAIVMDPRTNAVLAMANWPRVDANDLAGTTAYARQNRAVAAAYEPGSTFKAVTVAGAISDALVSVNTPFDLPPAIQVADRVIHESHERGPARLTTAEILAQSSNVGAITIGLKLGAHRFDGWVRRFGFGRPTGIDLPGEGSGILLPVDRYSGSSMGNLPIGQGLAVTPIQMAVAYAAIANGGILRPPHVVAQVGDRRVKLPAGRRIIADKTAANLREMLEGVLAPGGTAPEAVIPGYTLAGKTGTANKPDPVTGGYSQSKYVASFVGFAPARDPKLLVQVMVDEPRGSIYGGQVAAPAFKAITEFALPYLRIPPG